MNSIGVLLISLSFWHPLHLSLSTVESTTTSTIVMVKVFTDDFERLLKLKVDKTLNIQDEVFTDYEIKTAVAYIKNNLKLRVGNDELIFAYNDVKQNHEATWWYFKTSTIVDKEELHIYNSLMNELFKDQRNLFILKTAQGDNAVSFTSSKVQVTLDIP